MLIRAISLKVSLIALAFSSMANQNDFSQNMQATDTAQTSVRPTVDFVNPSEQDNWVIVNDTVMGGRSRASLQIENDALVFAGELSLENNGGFASVRRSPNDHSWQNVTPFEIEVTGDGREYQFRLRTDQNTDGIAYVAEFKTNEGKREIFRFIQSDFSPRWRGRYVRNSPSLLFTDVSQIGIMLSDKSPGSFTLSIHSISQAN